MKRRAWWWVLILFVHLLNNLVFADQSDGVGRAGGIRAHNRKVVCSNLVEIRPSKTGWSFGRSSREPKYKMEFHPEDAPFHPDRGKFGIVYVNMLCSFGTTGLLIDSKFSNPIFRENDDDQESMVMQNKNGEKFMCFLPKVEKSKSGKPVNPQNTSSLILKTEKRIKAKTPDELLEVLKDSCFIRQEGWWSYEFCYQKHLRQIHSDDDKVVVQECVLGVYDAEATEAYNQNLSDISTLKDPRPNDASQRYHAHQYTNGTTCDLTNEPRETEVRFVCSEPRAMISSITELSTCKYALTIQCPTLCKHPLFQEERPVWHTINCNGLPKDYKEEKVEGNSFPDETIAMVTDFGGYPPGFESEESAT